MMAGEVKDPQRNIPLSLVVGIFLLIALYCGANAAYYSIIPRDQMRELKDTTVATEFCARLLGQTSSVPMRPAAGGGGRRAARRLSPAAAAAGTAARPCSARRSRRTA